MTPNAWRKPGLSDKENAFLDTYEAELESPAYKHGYDVGVSMGIYEAESMAIAAYEAGETDLYIEFITPKSMADWAAFEAKHGTISEFKKRWVGGDSSK